MFLIIVFLMIVSVNIYLDRTDFDLKAFSLSISTTLLGILITVFYVDRVINNSINEEKEKRWDPARKSINKIIDRFISDLCHAIIIEIKGIENIEHWLKENNKNHKNISNKTNEKTELLLEYAENEMKVEQLSKISVFSNLDKYNNIYKELLDISDKIQIFLSYSHDSLDPRVLSSFINMVETINMLESHIESIDINYVKKFEDSVRSIEEIREKSTGERLPIIEDMLKVMEGGVPMAHKYYDRTSAALMHSVISRASFVYEYTKETLNKKYI